MGNRQNREILQGNVTFCIFIIYTALSALGHVFRPKTDSEQILSKTCQFFRKCRRKLVAKRFMIIFMGLVEKVIDQPI